MGKSSKLFKTLVAGVKALKLPSKEKPEKDKSACKPDKERVKKGNKEKCLWSLGKSASRNRDSFTPEGAFLDVPELKCTEVENNHVKEVLITGHSFTTKPDYGPGGLIKAGYASFTDCDPVKFAEQEEWAAIKIQAAYRRHLALHQVNRALRAAVRLQACVRGHMVRKHASAALRCMQALVKLQALARGRRVRASELGQLIQKHLQQTQQRKKLVESWVSSMATVHQSQAKAQSKQDAAVKRQRALVYAFSEQLNKSGSKQNTWSAIDFQPDKSHWSWVWLERWMAARPWGKVTVEEQSKEETVNTNADAEVNAPSSSDCVDFVPHSQESPSEVLTEAMPCVVEMKEDRRHTPAYLETVQGESKSETESYNSETKEVVGRPLLFPPPPPPPPPPNAKRPKPVVAYQTRSHKDKQVNTCNETSGTMEALRTTSSARGAELLGDACTSMLGTHLESSSATLVNTPSETSGAMEALYVTSSTMGAELLGETCTSTLATHLESLDFTSSPVKDSTPSTSSHLSIGTITTRSTPQSHPDSPLHFVQVTATTTSATPDDDELLNAKHDISMPITTASDSAPYLSLQSPSSPTAFSEMSELPPLTQPPLSHATFSEMLALSPQTHAVACSPFSIPDVIYDDMSNEAYTPDDNGTTDRTSLTVETIMNGFNEGEVTENSVKCVSVDVKDDPVEIDMDVEEAESDSIDFKSGEAIKADSLSNANGGLDAFVASAGEKSSEVSPSKYNSPVSKQGQHTEAVLPPVPNYMTTTQSSKAKIRILTSPTQKSESPKQKRDSPKPRFDSSKQKLGESPKLKFESPKQKVDSPVFPKQKLDSPKQRMDHATKRRHSLSALEGKGSPAELKSTLHSRASCKGQSASLKDTYAEKSTQSNEDRRRHAKLIVA